jgi:hypothetical protein
MHDTGDYSTAISPKCSRYRARPFTEPLRGSVQPLRADRLLSGARDSQFRYPTSLVQHQRIAALWRTADRHEGNLLHRRCIDHGH